MYCLSMQRRLPKKEQCKGKFNKSEREAMRIFADSITPPNWNIFTDYENYRKERGVLNIYLDIRDIDEEFNQYWNGNGKSPPAVNEGMVINGLRYVNGIGNVKIILHPQIFRWQDTIIHELAHVAVLRTKGRKEKANKQLAPSHSENGEIIKYVEYHFIISDRESPREHKTKRFRQAQQTLIKRAERYNEKMDTEKH